MSVPGHTPATQARRMVGLWPAWFCRYCLYCGLVTTFAWSVDCTANADETLPLKDQPHLRRPIAAVPIERGGYGRGKLAIANQASGTISITDHLGARAIEEIPVGERLSSIAADPHGRWLYVTDDQRHELIVLEILGATLQIKERIRVSPYPASVAVSTEGALLAIASLWSRKVTVLAVNDDGSSLKELATITLPFNPRLQAFFSNVGDGAMPPLSAARRLEDYAVVADAFGGNVAVIRARKPALVAVHQVDGHHISGLAAVGDVVKITHQVLPSRLPLADEVSSVQKVVGLVVAELRRDDVITRAAMKLPSTEVPSFVPYSRRYRDPLNIRRTVGGAELFRFGGEFIVLGPTPPPSPAERGEKLFYDPAMSAGKWMSCHTCHIDGHTSGELADTRADGTVGTPKRIPTLLGTRLSDPWAWNGRFRNLDEQVRSSLETTMHVRNATAEQVGDITAFLHTLKPPPPLEPATDDPDDQAKLARGKALFGTLGCAKCHVPPLTYTSSDTYDVGLTDEAGMSKFNPPSLRGVSQGYSFFHDGRAKTLEEVFTVHGHQLDRDLSAKALADLLRFLRSL